MLILGLVSFAFLIFGIYRIYRNCRRGDNDDEEFFESLSKEDEIQATTIQISPEEEIRTPPSSDDEDFEV